MKGMSDFSSYSILATAAVLGLFLGFTFDTLIPVSLTTALACIVVFRRRRTLAADPSPKHSRLYRVLRYPLIFFGTLAMLAATASWRVGSHVGENFNAVYIGIETVA